MTKLDYSLKTPEERRDLVNKICQEAEEEGVNLTESYLENLANYIIFCVEKEERKKNKQRQLLTSNRMITLNKHEISYEGLVETFEQGEDHIYNLISQNGGDKHVIFTPKISITKADIEKVPYLK